jgi:hypothetical protein
MLPDNRDERNALPVWDGCIAYFPDCWAEIAKVSVQGNKQHGLGAKLHFARDISTDHANKVMRHMLDHAAGNVMDSDGTYHLAKAAWRALAALQVAIEAQTSAGSPSAVQLEDIHRQQQAATRGKTYSENSQFDSGQGLCPPGTPLSDRKQVPRPERAQPSIWERLARGEGDSQGESPC